MKASVIVCAYNEERYISRCIDSILNQSFNDYEIIIINDGSKDETQRIIDEYIRKDNRIKSYYQENSGQAVGRNKGIDLSKGEYIVFVDADDEIEKDYLLNLPKAIDLGIDFGYSSIQRIFDGKPSKLEKSFNYIHTAEIKDSTALENKEVFTKIMNAPYAKIIKSDFLKENKIRFAEGKLYEDFMFTQSILLNNPKLTRIEDSSYKYYVHKGTSMTSKGDRAFDMIDVFDSTLDLCKIKHLEQALNDEYEYLALYHIAIGTLYRSFMHNPLSFFLSLKRCRSYLKSKNYTRHNKYMKGASLFVRLYLCVFYSFL